MTSHRAQKIGFWRSQFIADVKGMAAVIAICLLLSLDYVR
ncbi:membrane protein [Gordonia phage VanLee]|uniref:Membrane protein n=1 Tax=Gordonia phage VanLee TaxID=2845816 RepID=A0A8F2DAJ6_9CAUD|nr:membrane protein [Gordonia phage VanLee]QWS68267.1 membrane protein [Gordonia phage VanLee]